MLDSARSTNNERAAPAAWLRAFRPSGAVAAERPSHGSTPYAGDSPQTAAERRHIEIALGCNFCV